MKTQISIFFFLILFNTISFAQCVLNATSRTQGKVTSCISSCGCTTLEIPTATIVDMDGSWDLRSRGQVDVKIKGTGGLIFSGNGSNAEVLSLASGSKLIVENTSNMAALVQTGGVGQTRINIGSTQYTGHDLANIIAAGGATEAGYGVSSGNLPVEFSGFDLSIIKNAVSLEWSTASEINNDHFEIEHSTDNLHFTTVGIVKGKGNATTTNKYAYKHLNPSVGINYYRVKQVDFDGKFDYSHTLSTEIKGIEIKTGPNPVVDYMNYKGLGLEKNTKAGLSLVNANGLEVLKTDLTTNEGNIDLSGLAPGVYYLKIKTGQGVYTNRLVKQ